MKVGIALEEKPAIGALFTQNMMALLQNADVQETAPAQGDGTENNPYKDLHLQNWRWLAAQPAKPDTVFYSIGGRKLVRWGSNMSTLKDYISDMTGKEDILGSALGDPGKTSANNVIGAFADPDKEHLAPYHRKALRLDQMTDIEAASRCRALLLDSNHDCAACPELASSCASLFIAEANRAPRTFVISLMLLDLIESGASYGIADNKKYTWISMLAHSKKTGPDMNVIDIRGRTQNKTIPLAKHPMAGLNTVSLAKSLDNWGTDNASRDRVVSLMSIWIGLYLKATQPGDYYLLRTTSKVAVKEQVKETGKTVNKQANKPLTERLSQLAGGALQQRVGTAGKLVNGGPNLPYMDLDLKVIPLVVL